MFGLAENASLTQVSPAQRAGANPSSVLGGGRGHGMAENQLEMALLWVLCVLASILVHESRARADVEDLLGCTP